MFENLKGKEIRIKKDVKKLKERKIEIKNIFEKFKEIELKFEKAVKNKDK